MKSFNTKPVSYLLSTVVCLMISLLATAQIVPAPSTNTGSGYISNVEAVTPGACVQSTVNGNNQFWDIAQGNTYIITLSNVTDCANGGTDATIEVIVKNSNTGNTCVTASLVSTGVYEFEFTMPAEACATFPILYCTNNCSSNSGTFVQDLLQDGVGHLRTSYFDGNCDKTSTDNDCESPCTFNTQIDGDTEICDGETTQLCVNDGISWEWSNGSTDACITVGDAGDYSVVVFDANGCSAEASASLILNTPPTVSVSPSSPDPVCEGSCVTLTASGATDYVWSPNGEITPSIEACTSGTYSVTGTDGNGCTAASAEVTVTILPPPTVTITPSNPDPVCEGTCVTLTASGAVDYVWSPNGETTASIEACTSGNYSVTGTDGNGCTAASAEVTVTILPPPTVTITPSNPDPVCEGSCVTLTASGAVDYVWSPNGEITSSIEACASGDYSVTGTDGNGCTATSAATTVAVNPNPACDMITPTTPPVFGLPGNKLKANITCPEGCNCTYDWSVSSSDDSWIITAGDNTTEVTYTCGNNGTTGTFTLTVTCTETGCNSSCEITITPTAQGQCSYTQGFYSNGTQNNGGGQAECLGLSALQSIQKALNSACGNAVPFCNPITIGYGLKTVTFGCTEALCIAAKLPGNSTAAVLPNNAPIASCAAIPSNNTWLQNGKLKNVLAGQTLTLSLNVRLFCDLANETITTSTFTTYKSTACANGNAVPGTAQTFTIPQSVINCLGATNTVSDLLLLANKKLGGQGCASVSLGEINTAVDAVNRGFDKCRLNSTNTIRMAGSNVSGGSENLKLSVYPNPAISETTVEFVSHQAGKAVIDIIGLNGALVAQLFNSDVTSNTTNQILFDTNELQPGTYFIRVTTGNETAYSRLVVIR